MTAFVVLGHGYCVEVYEKVLGIYSEHSFAYRAILNHMNHNTIFDCYFIQEWTVDGERINVHRYEHEGKRP